jgi:hypothetical protein
MVFHTQTDLIWVDGPCNISGITEKMVVNAEVFLNVSWAPQPKAPVPSLHVPQLFPAQQSESTEHIFLLEMKQG